jgi:hypothetical protein
VFCFGGKDCVVQTFVVCFGCHEEKKKKKLCVVLVGRAVRCRPLWFVLVVSFI